MQCPAFCVCCKELFLLSHFYLSSHLVPPPHHTHTRTRTTNTTTNTTTTTMDTTTIDETVLQTYAVEYMGGSLTHLIVV